MGHLKNRLPAAATSFAMLAIVSTLITPPAWLQTVTTIDFPGAMHTRLFGINPSGEIVGLYIKPDGTIHGLSLDRNGLTAIDVPGAVFTNVIDINPAGEMVGTFALSPGMFHGYLLNKEGFHTIDVPGLSSHRPTALMRVETSSVPIKMRMEHFTAISSAGEVSPQSIFPARSSRTLSTSTRKATSSELTRLQMVCSIRSSSPGVYSHRSTFPVRSQPAPPTSLWASIPRVKLSASIGMPTARLSASFWTRRVSPPLIFQTLRPLLRQG
jgi:hypothetical protein